MTSHKAGRTISCFMGVAEVRGDVAQSKVTQVSLNAETNRPTYVCPYYMQVLKGGSFVVVLCCLFWCQSFVDVSPYVCSYYFKFGFGF